MVQGKGYTWVDFKQDEPGYIPSGLGAVGGGGSGHEGWNPISSLLQGQPFSLGLRKPGAATSRISPQTQFS